MTAEHQLLTEQTVTELIQAIRAWNMTMVRLEPLLRELVKRLPPIAPEGAQGDTNG